MRLERFTWILFLTAAIALIALNPACVKSSAVDPSDDGDSSDRYGYTGGGDFTLRIRGAGSSGASGVTAKPEDVSSLVITIDQVQVHRIGDGEAGWYTIEIEESTFDLMESGLEEVIASSGIPAGEYNQLRFGVDSAQVTTESGEYEAEVPSGKLKVNITFEVFEDGSTEITITIDPKASLVIAGNASNPKYMLKPVIHVVDVEEEEEDD